LFPNFKTLAYLDVELQRCEQVKGKDVFDFSGVVVKRVNKTKVRGLSGNMIYHHSIDNNYTVKIYNYVKQGGEYRKLPFAFPEKGFCNFYNEDPYFYPDLVEHSDYTMPLPCPIPAVTSF
jgi:hypothetical protein